jgi:hypothetical protein
MFPKTVKLFGFVRTWWRQFKERVVLIKFDIYVFITSGLFDRTNTMYYAYAYFCVKKSKHIMYEVQVMIRHSLQYQILAIIFWLSLYQPSHITGLTVLL